MMAIQQMWKHGPRIVVMLGLMAGLTPGARADLSAGELAKMAQNPVSAMVSLPFQNNIQFNDGPRKRTKNVLDILPVVPIYGNGEWSIITRSTLPVIYQPSSAPNQDATTGLGDAQVVVFVSPSRQKSFIWRIGAVTQLPTHSNNQLGNDNWGLGPAFVMLHLDKEDPWVYGLLLNNIWSLSDDKPGGSYNNGVVQPFINYNFPGGTYLTSSMMSTVNWKADRDQRWTVPLGGGIGHVFHIGKQPVNTQISAYYNIVRPDDSPNWQLRFQVQFLFPE